MANIGGRGRIEREGKNAGEERGRDGRINLHNQGNFGRNEQRVAKPFHSRNGNKAQRIGKLKSCPTVIKMGRVGEPHRRMNSFHLLQSLPPEVILEIQFNPSNKNKINIYNDILARIRLDSPITFQTISEGNDNNGYDQVTGAQLVNTPIFTNTTNLMVLTKYVLTPRQ